MPQIYNSTGTRIYFWRVGKSASRKLLPLNIKSISHPGVAIPVRDTTHLLTPPPDDANQFGGRMYKPGDLGDPGEFSLGCLADPSVVLPKGELFIQVLFPRLLGFATPPKWLGMGFFTMMGGFTVSDVDVNVETTMTIKLSGVFTITAARRTA